MQTTELCKKNLSKSEKVISTSFPSTSFPSATANPTIDVKKFLHPSIHCSTGSPPVGVQCCLQHRSPHALILCLPVEHVNFLFTPFLDVIQPFSHILYFFGKKRILKIFLFFECFFLNFPAANFAILLNLLNSEIKQLLTSYWKLSDKEP